MSEMSDSYFPLNIDIREEGSLVVDAKGEDTVLIGCLKSSAVKGTVDASRDWSEIEAMER